MPRPDRNDSRTARRPSTVGDFRARLNLDTGCDAYCMPLAGA